MCEMYWLILPLLLQREKKKFLNVYLVPFFKNVLVISFKFNIAETLSFLHQLFGSCYFQSYGRKFFSVDILSLAGRLISFLIISIACYRKKRKMAGVDIFVGLFFMPKLPSVFFSRTVLRTAFWSRWLLWMERNVWLPMFSLIRLGSLGCAYS